MPRIEYCFNCRRSASWMTSWNVRRRMVVMDSGKRRATQSGRRVFNDACRARARPYALAAMGNFARGPGSSTRGAAGLGRFLGLVPACGAFVGPDFRLAAREASGVMRISDACRRTRCRRSAARKKAASAHELSASRPPVGLRTVPSVGSANRAVYKICKSSHGKFARQGCKDMPPPLRRTRFFFAAVATSTRPTRSDLSSVNHMFLSGPW